MPDESIIGVNYFDHQFLRQQDFDAARKHHEDRLRQHNRLAHRPGVVDGLEVTRVGTTSVLQISLGRAIDSEFREAVLRQTAAPEIPPLVRVQTSVAEFQETEAHLTGPLEINLAGVPASALTDNPVFLTIRQGVKETTPTQDPGLTGNRRLVERAVIEAGIARPSGAQLLLAQVNRNPSGAVTGIRLDERRQSSSVLADGSVTEPKLATNSVSARTIQTAAVTGPKLAAGAVTGDKITNDAVGMAKLDSDVRAAITSGGIPDGGVTEPKLANNAVSASKLRSDATTDANRAVTTNHIRNGAVVEAKLADGAVNLAKLRFQQVNAGKDDVLAGQPVTKLVEKKSVASVKTTIYFPSLTIFNAGGIGSAEVEAQILYRFLTGASTVDVLIRLTNLGGAPVSVDWVVNTFAP